jgi:hypothetical protein
MTPFANPRSHFEASVSLGAKTFEGVEKLSY